MNLDRFLEFWSHHNQTIIQVLIVVTLLFIVALVFITLFGSKEDASPSQGTVGLSPELEKSLQKMLENQVHAKSAVFDFSGGQSGDPQLKPVGGGASAGPDRSAEIEKLKAEMASRDKALADLQIQLQQAAASGKSSGGNTSGMESRIKELEARLAEYDIISEDIADLSRFKEENEKLKAQLAGAGTAAPAAAPAAAPPAAPPQSPPPAPVTTAEPAAAPAPQVAPAAPAAPSPAEAAIDDDLMKEFAAAVEGQKAATAAPPPPNATAENEDLMGQFENFVQKKEGT